MAGTDQKEINFTSELFEIFNNKSDKLLLPREKVNEIIARLEVLNQENSKKKTSDQYYYLSRNWTHYEVIMFKKQVEIGCQTLTAIILSCFMSRVACWEVWNSSCYLFSTTEKNHGDSIAACKEIYGHLVEIETTEEHVELQKYMESIEQYWIGAQLSRTDNQFYWSVGGGKVLESLWASYAPNDNVECARLRTYNFKNVLDDRTCSVEYRYICEKYEDMDMLYSCSDSQTSDKIDKQEFIPRQSSADGMPEKVIDGNYNTDPSNCTTTGIGAMVWWQVDLNGHYVINSIKITISQDYNAQYYTDGYLRNLEIRVHSINPISYEVNATYQICSTFVGRTSETESSITIECGTLVAGRYIRIVKTSDSNSTDSILTLCEVDVYGYECTQQQQNDTCEIPVVTYNFSSTEQYTTTQDSSQADNQTSPCVCPCSKTIKANMSDDELQEIVQQMISELSVPQKSTNIYLRSLSSADDKRLSAKGVGSIGVVILCTVLLLLVASDMVKFGSFTYKKYLSWKKTPSPRRAIKKSTRRFSLSNI